MIANLAEWERRYRRYRQIETSNDPLAGVDGDVPSHEVPVDGPAVETTTEVVFVDGRHWVAQRSVADAEEP